MKKELRFYEKVNNWDFSQIKIKEESLTNWDQTEILNELVNEESKVLDLGTGGGEKVLRRFPKVKEILGTDYSPEMIKTANENLKKTNKDYITFRIMDNLKMDVEDDYYDVVVARHTVIDAKQIYKALKKGGYLLLRGVDKLDCWSLKKKFDCGQAYSDIKPISLIDYEAILDAGFKDVELVPIHIREYYETKEDLVALLLKAPILVDFSEEHENESLDQLIDEELLDEYIKENTYEKGILLIRRYYGIIAKK